MPTRKNLLSSQHIRNTRSLNRNSFASDEQFFHQVVESLDDYVIFTTDIDGYINSWNKGAEKILGYNEKEILGKNAVILFTPEDIAAKKPEKELVTSRTRGRAVDERWHVRKNKSRFWGSGLVFPLKDDGGKLQGFTKVMRDLTERRVGIQKIKESQERYRAFVEQSTEGIWRFELEKALKISTPIKKQIDHFYEYAYLAECNNSMAKMYGYKKAEDILGMRLGRFLVRESKENIEYLTAFIQSGYRLNEIESEEKDKKGNTVYFLNSLVGIVENGLLLRAWGTQRDITEQKKTVVALSRLADIVESSQDSILSRSLDGRILSWNKGAEQMYGFTADEAVGNKILITIPPERKHEAQEIINALKRGEHVTQFETVRRRKNGSFLDVSISVSPINDAEGNLIGISTIARDITEMKKLQAQKDDFVAIASHELKTPVTSIKAYTQVLEHRFAKEGDKTSVSLLAKMDAQINKLNNLIGDLLDVTKIESGRLRFNVAQFDFNELLREVVEEMQRTTDRHHIDLEIGKSKQIHADKERVGQVLMNLISNAIKYSPNADQIIVKTESRKGSITLSVQDFGVGIPKNKLDHVFERFFRVSGPQQNTFPGMGLGLYISSEIIKRQGGRIWVESHFGKGSKFCFTLPLGHKTTPKKNTSRHRERISKAPRSLLR